MKKGLGVGGNSLGKLVLSSTLVPDDIDFCETEILVVSYELEKFKGATPLVW